MYADLILLIIAAAQPLPAKDIRFPTTLMHASAPLGGNAKLSADQWFVVDSDVPVIVTASLLGLVSITEEVGPIKVRGVFVGGTGKTETRTFTGKQVFFIEALSTGTCEILAIPATAKSASDIVRRSIDVNVGPRPPPTPDPPVNAVKHLSFIGANQATAAVVNDTALREWLKAQGIKVHVLSVGDPLIESTGLSPAVKKAGGFPCVVLQDGGGVVVDQERLSTSEAVKALVKLQEGK